mmetsp:Transcript_12130/g.35043  ORF Transcript_12130/g.35043 Transcript_12130/m.35043 type:complete len:283 (-) Transcript_12130:91-939(-)
MSTSLASSAAEYGIMLSPGRFSSIHALSFGSHLFFLRKKSFSDMLTRWRAVLEVSRQHSLSTSISLVLHAPKRASFSLTNSRILFMISSRSFFSLALPSLFTSFSSGSISFSSAATSFSRSSSRMISRSRTGSTESSTCVAMSPSAVSSKVRTTWKMASVAEMWERKALPRPSPSAAPLTRPAMSKMVRYAGTSFFGFHMSHSLRHFGSGTSTLASVGSMVQKGKFSAGTDILHMMLNVVDLPTFGMPTTPALTWLVGRPRMTRGFSSSFFLGGMPAIRAGA